MVKDHSDRERGNLVCVLISIGLLCEHGSVKAHSKWAKKKLLQFSAGLFVEILVCVCGWVVVF